MNDFNSEFASVTYIEKDHVVFLVWKKEAHYEDYRKPTTFALELLRQYPVSNFLFDARNGFEDVAEDVTWGFQFLLPEMKKAGCSKVGFILNEVNDIEDEMDLWSKEFSKYFELYRETSYERLLQKM